MFFRVSSSRVVTAQVARKSSRPKDVDSSGPKPSGNGSSRPKVIVSEECRFKWPEILIKSVCNISRSISDNEPNKRDNCVKVLFFRQ